MSDLHYWRHVQFHHRVEWAHPDAHEKSVEAFDASPFWERVHVLTDADLAAHDAQVRAEALREAADGLTNLAGIKGCNPFCHRADASALHIRADQIEQEGAGQ